MNDSPGIALPELVDLAASPCAATPSPFESPACLLVHSGGQEVAPDAAERQSVAAWLSRQACPVIAIGAGDHDPWRDVYDVIVDDIAAAAPLLTNIKRAPLAAMTLVQTLRVTAALPVDAALIVESLAYATLQGGSEFRAWSAVHPPRPAPVDAVEPAVLVDRKGSHLDIRLNRPARRNTVSVDMRDALVEALHLVLADATIDTVTVSGNGDCFSIGGDLDEFGTAPDPASAHAIRSLRLPAALAARCADRLHCHLHGACIGAGVEIPAFAHRVTAARKSFFQLPEIRFGLIPGAGGCVGIPRRIGRQRTAWLALSARRIDAPTALAWGLVDALI